MSFWIDLFLAFRANKFPEYFHGLTPMLIVGACQIPIGKKFENEELAYRVTKQIFNEIKSYYDNGLIVQSTLCPNFNGPVFSFADTEWKQNSINITFNELWNRYGFEIIIGNFNITSKDHEIIEKINSP